MALDGTPCRFIQKASEEPQLCVLMNKTRCLSFLFNVKSPWTVTGTKRIFTCVGTPGSWIICWRLCSFLKLPRVTRSRESTLIYSLVLWVQPSLLFVLMCNHSWGMCSRKEREGAGGTEGGKERERETDAIHGAEAVHSRRHMDVLSLQFLIRKSRLCWQ